jgi:hypothetical protein
MYPKNRYIEGIIVKQFVNPARNQQEPAIARMN